MTATTSGHEVRHTHLPCSLHRYTCCATSGIHTRLRPKPITRENHVLVCGQMLTPFNSVTFEYVFKSGSKRGNGSTTQTPRAKGDDNITQKRKKTTASPQENQRIAAPPKCSTFKKERSGEKHNSQKGKRTTTLLSFA